MRVPHYLNPPISGIGYMPTMDNYKQTPPFPGLSREIFPIKNTRPQNHPFPRKWEHACGPLICIRVRGGGGFYLRHVRNMDTACPLVLELLLDGQDAVVQDPWWMASVFYAVDAGADDEGDSVVLLVGSRHLCTRMTLAPVPPGLHGAGSSDAQYVAR